MKPFCYTAATLAVGQGALLVVCSFIPVASGGLSWRVKQTHDWASKLGVATCVYATVGHPIASYVAGHAYPASTTLGMPTPTCMLLLGVLLLSDGSGVPLPLLAVPGLWALTWTVSMFSLRMYEDLPMLLVLVIAFVYVSFTEPYTPVGDPATLARAKKLEFRAAQMNNARRRADWGSKPKSH